VVLAMTGTISPFIAALLMPASSLTVLLGSYLGTTFVPASAPSVVAVASGEKAKRERAA
jgi:hypothetical protein